MQLLLSKEQEVIFKEHQPKSNLMPSTQNIEKNIITKIGRSKFHLPCSTGGSSIVNCNEGMYIMLISSGTYRVRE